MAAGPTTVVELPDEEKNCLVFCHLTTKVGIQAIRTVFDRIVPPANLATFLNSKRNELQKLLKRKILYPAQHNLLFPQASPVKSDDFDITLMVCLIRNIFNVTPPTTGWDALPNPTDLTEEADIARIKYYRNNFLAHRPVAEMSNVEFNMAATDVRAAISRLSSTSLDAEVQKILDMTVVSSQDLKEELDSLKEERDSLKEQLDDLIQELTDNIDVVSVTRPDVYESRVDIQCVDIRIVLHGNDYKAVRKAEDLIRKALEDEDDDTKKEAAAWLSFSNIKNIKKVIKTNVGVIECVLGGSIILRIRCHSLRGLNNLLRYESQLSMKSHFDELATAVGQIVGDTTITVNAGITDYSIIAMNMEVRSMCLENDIELPMLVEDDNLQILEETAESMNNNDVGTTDDLPQAAGPLYTKKIDDEVVTTDEPPQAAGPSHTRKGTLDIDKDLREDTMTYITETMNETDREVTDTTTNSGEEAIQHALGAMKMKSIEFEKNTFERIVNIGSQDTTQEKTGLSTIIETGSDCAEEIEVIKVQTSTMKKRIDTIAENIKEAEHHRVQESALINVHTSAIQKIIDPIPENIKGQHVLTIETWRKDESTFIETHAAKSLLDTIIKTSCLTVTGNSGSGKSAAVHHVALKLEDLGYTIIPIHDIADIQRYFDVSKKQVFILDDPIGTDTLNESALVNSESASKTILTMLTLSDTKVMVTCRKSILRNPKFAVSKSFLQNSIFDMSSEQHILPEHEQKLILESHSKHLSKDLIQNGADINLCDNDGISPLYKAAHEGRVDDVSVLIQHGADVNMCSNEGVSPLCQAAQTSNVDVISILIQNDANVNLCSNDGTSPLHMAAMKGHVEVVSVLIQNGADVNLCRNDGLSPLYKAAQNGHVEVASVLLQHGADVNLCSNDGVSPLYIAAQNVHVEVVSVFIQHGADVNLCRNDGVSPLYMAAQNGHVEVVSVLIQHGADVNLCINDGVSPLYMAAQNGHVEVVSVLIQHGADVNLCSNDGVSPLHMAAQNDTVEVVYVLIQHGADVNLCSNDGVSPLHMAAQNDTVDVVTVLIQHGADVNLCSNDGVSPLYMAAHNGHVEVVSVLIQHGADVNLCSNDGVSPLYMAAHNGHVEVVSVLIQHGADVNLCSNDGVSPLYMVAHNGHVEVVSVLIQHGADVNLCSNDGVSPLYMAAQNGHVEDVSVLLQHGADINLCSNDGVSPLHMAEQYDTVEVVYVLIQHGADVNLCKNNGISPLHMAAHIGHVEVVSVLIQHEADVNLCDNDGVSPLYMAAHNGHVEVISVLIQHGADVNLCRNNGVSPLITSAYNGHERVVQQLLHSNADVNVVDKIGGTALSVATDQGHTKIVEMLEKCLKQNK